MGGQNQPLHPEEHFQLSNSAWRVLWSGLGGAGGVGAAVGAV